MHDDLGGVHLAVELRITNSVLEGIRPAITQFSERQLF
jgi:hypothetical protein